MLAGAAVVAVLAGTGVAWVAASGDDDPASSSSTSAPTSEGATDDRAGGDTATGATPETTPDGTSTQRSQPTTTSPKTTTEPADRQRPGAKHRRIAVPPARVFAGTGSTWIGTIVVREPSTVRWSAPGRLSIRFGRERFPVIAPSRSGQLTVPPYSFELVRVIARGSWRIKISPMG
jgi:hypothetical protein